MNKLLFTLTAFAFAVASKAQDDDTAICISGAYSIMNVIASDSLNGRVTYTEDAEKTVDFITNYFRKNRIEKLASWPDYKAMYINSSNIPAFLLTVNNQIQKPNSYYVNSPDEFFDMAQWKNCHVIYSYGTSAYIDSVNLIQDSIVPVIVLNKQEDSVANIYIEKLPYAKKFIVITTDEIIESITVAKNPVFTKTNLINVVGIIEGKTKPTELILVSAHYDHVNTGIKSNSAKDKIYNGANDNASGTTAVLMLAKYFSQIGPQDRTIVFCLFGGEEKGLLGSDNMAEDFKPRYIKCMLNIEMIGRSDTKSKDVIFFTGYNKSGLGKQLKPVASANSYQIIAANEKNFLFERSDNYSFFLKGVTAHTLMTSTDEDNYYHHPKDEIMNIDFEHLVKTTKCIAELIKLVAKEDFSVNR